MGKKKRTRGKEQSMFSFLDVELRFDSDVSESLREQIKKDIFGGAIVLSLKSLHGEVGKAISFDILYYDEVLRRAYIRVLSKNLVKFWSSLTLFSSFLQKECLFQVHQVENSISQLKIKSDSILKLVEGEIKED